MKILKPLYHRLSLFLTMITLGIIGLVSPETLEGILGIDFTEGLDEI